MKKLLYFFIILICAASCNILPQNEHHYASNNKYAERFSIENIDSCKHIVLYNPWQGAEGEKLNYILAKTDFILADSLKNYKRINIPVKKVAVFSTTHIGFIRALGETGGIKGVSGIQYICDQGLQIQAEQQNVKEIGFPPDINYELLLKMKPDLVFLYGLDPTIASIAARLEKSGIPAILIAEFLESHPLGKMEWIKVFGAVYEKESIADSIYESARIHYEKLTQIAGSRNVKPEVFTGMPWKDTWYMAGGRSFSAQLIKDAGGNYLWKNDASFEFIPLSLESVLMKAINADFWINTGTASSLKDIEARDSRFCQLNAFKNGAVFNNDALICSTGGNEFWERGTVEPHIILEDLIKIFHPGLLDSHSLVYYRKMQ